MTIDELYKLLENFIIDGYGEGEVYFLDDKLLYSFIEHVEVDDSGDLILYDHSRTL